jgi:hypothetical protein
MSCKVFSAFFAGDRDFRQLYATLNHVLQCDRCPCCKNHPDSYYFTVNDVNVVNFARNLVILWLLDRLGRNEDHKCDKAVATLNTIFFTFSTLVMPSYAAAQLQRTITAVLKALKTSRGMPKYIFIHDKDRKGIIEVLESWSGFDEKTFPVSEAIQMVVKKQGDDIHRAERLLGDYPPPNRCDVEQKLYRATAFVQPATRLFEAYEPAFKEMVAKTTKSYRRPFPEVRDGTIEYLTHHWKVNVTAVDPKWESESATPHAGRFFGDPFSLGTKLYRCTHLEPPPRATCAYDYVAYFFSEAAKSLKRDGDRMTIEFSIGDFASELEKRRYGLVPELRKTPSPRHFDRIYLSNVL